MKRERDINYVGLLIRLWTRGCEGTIRQCYHPYLVELDRFVAHHLARALPVMMAAAVRFVETVVDVWPSNTPAMDMKLVNGEFPTTLLSTTHVQVLRYVLAGVL